MKATSVRSESSERVAYSPHYHSSILGKDDGKESWGILSEAEDKPYFWESQMINARRNWFSLFDDLKSVSDFNVDYEKPENYSHLKPDRIYFYNQVRLPIPPFIPFDSH